MYSKRSGLMLGFHGCDVSVLNRVLSGEEDLKPSQNNWDWLGHGIYFWENNSDRALEFAKEQSGRFGSKIISPAVIGAVIDLGYCLDLMEMQNISLVKSTYSALKDVYAKAGENLPKNTDDLIKRSLDCAVINSLHIEQDLIQSFDSVKGIFTEGNPIYENAGFREKDHIQICIRNTECIKGYFLPRNKHL